MYQLGQGVAKDPIEAFKWVAMAARNGVKEAEAILQVLTKEMNPEQLAEANRRIDTFAQKSAPKKLLNVSTTPGPIVDFDLLAGTFHGNLYLLLLWRKSLMRWAALPL